MVENPPKHGKASEEESAVSMNGLHGNGDS